MRCLYVLHSDIEKKISFEISELEKELDSYKLLFELCKTKEPDLIEITAIASVLHSFYNGIEGIFMIISKQIDKYIPQSYNWHSDLLKRMTEKNEARKNVISQETFDILEEYLGFRHFFRHSYKFRLDWNKLENLTINLNETWTKLKKEINTFLLSD